MTDFIIQLAILILVFLTLTPFSFFFFKKNVDIKKYIFFILGIIIILINFILIYSNRILKEFNDGFWPLVVFFYSTLIILSSLILYFINFYFLQKLTKEQNNITKWNYYTFTNLTIFLTLFSLLFLIIYKDINEIYEFRIPLPITEKYVLFLFLFTIIIFPFLKILKILRKFEKFNIIPLILYSIFFILIYFTTYLYIESYFWSSNSL